MSSTENKSPASAVPLCLFQIGKGGVGKSTLSALMALSLARSGKRVLLLSLDPAHNQSDIFQKAFGEQAIDAAPHLQVREPDVDRWIARYLEDVQQRMRENYTYLTAISLDQYFRVLRHSPGLEEFALRAIFQETLRHNAHADVIVVDMPPTALALRFFASPTLSGVWTDELLRLRAAIKEKRKIITRIRFGKKEIEQDRVLTRLEEERDSNNRLRALFVDKTATRVTVVINPDLLSWMESRRIVAALSPLGITPAALAINKSISEAELAALPPELSQFPRFLLPHADHPLIGLNHLHTYLNQYPSSIPT